MKSVDRALGLYLRKGTYYFRKAVPERVRFAFNDQKEVTRSLRTGNLVAAIRLARRFHVDFDEQISNAENAGLESSATCCNLDNQQIDKWIREYVAVFERQLSINPWAGKNRPDLSAIETVRSARGPATNILSAAKDLKVVGDTSLISGFVDDLIRKEGIEQPISPNDRQDIEIKMASAWLEAANRYSLKLSGEVVPEFVDPFFDPQKYVKLSLLKSVPFGEVADDFYDKQSRKWAPKTRLKYKGALALAKEHFGASTPISSIVRTDCKAYISDVLEKLPPNWGKNRSSARRQVKVLASESAASNKVIISQKTQAVYLGIVLRIFDWAVEDQLIDVSPAAGLKIIKDRIPKTSVPRVPFELPELRLIFSAPIYSGCKDDGARYATPGENKPKRARFWMPLIALFSGMRLNEIVSLRTRDIGIEDDVWFIDVVEDLSANKELKNLASVRVIPVHSALMEIGFADFVISKQNAKEEYLFGEITAKGDRRPSDNFSQWFGRFLKSRGIERPGTVFHSFRHLFRDALREADLSDARVKALGGWTLKEVHEEYGKGFKIPTLKEAIEKVEFDGLDLSHLKN